MTRVAVIGAGAWGTALANLLAAKGESVHLWAFEPEVVAGINGQHVNPLYLTGCRLADTLRATGELTEAVRDAAVVVCVAPSHVARRVLREAAPAFRRDAILVCATKGIETDSLKLMSEVAAEELRGRPFVALSGPSFAVEVHQQQPTAVVAASRHAAAAAMAQELFATNAFRVYTNHDVIGTELGGALKNVIAIAAGILEGLGLGNNPRAALITRGLAEMTRLGVACGADAQTFAGLAGMGDLILTTCGALSRNRSLGVAVARGMSLDDWRRQHRTVAEGVNTAQAAAALGARHRVELPITEQVAAILFDGKPPRQAIADVMERTLKPEQWS
ncbi:MAG: NAD(P)H-dependent glycerol-3-phosphate dehydrogenase [Gemmatimonadales bacterium]